MTEKPNEEKMIQRKKEADLLVFEFLFLEQAELTDKKGGKNTTDSKMHPTVRRSQKL